MEKEEALKKEEIAAGTEVKSPEETSAATAPAGDKPVGETGASDAPSGEDIANVVMLLNQFNKIAGGKGEITDVPENLRGVIQFVVGKMVALRGIFYDPLFKAIADDMVDQREDGQEPSVKVAIARVIPINELQELADSEDYASAQEELANSKANAEKEAVSDEELYSKYEQSNKNIDAYCKKMGYDDAEREDFYRVINLWRDVFADGLISDAECQRIDKERNYDKDTASLKAQIPAEPTKEIVPDKSSVETASIKTPAQSSQNSIGNMAYVGSGTDYQNVGKRKIFAGKK